MHSFKSKEDFLSRTTNSGHVDFFLKFSALKEITKKNLKKETTCV